MLYILFPGNIVCPIVSRLLITQYGWRGSILITSALTLHVAIAALFLQPETSKAKQVDSDDPKKGSAKHSLIDEKEMKLFENGGTTKTTFEHHVVQTKLTTRGLFSRYEKLKIKIE